MTFTTTGLSATEHGCYLVLCHDGQRFRIMDGKRSIARGELRCYHGHWMLRDGYVHRAYRRRGLHSLLVNVRLMAARQAGAAVVRAWVRPTNAACLNSLVKLGFRFTGGAMRTFDGKQHVSLKHTL